MLSTAVRSIEIECCLVGDQFCHHRTEPATLTPAIGTAFSNRYCLFQPPNNTPLLDAYHAVLSVALTTAPHQLLHITMHDQHSPCHAKSSIKAMLGPSGTGSCRAQQSWPARGRTGVTRLNRSTTQVAIAAEPCVPRPLLTMLHLATPSTSLLPSTPRGPSSLLECVEGLNIQEEIILGGGILQINTMAPAAARQ